MKRDFFAHITQNFFERQATANTIAVGVFGLNDNDVLCVGNELSGFLHWFYCNRGGGLRIGLIGQLLERYRYNPVIIFSWSTAPIGVVCNKP